MNQNILLYYICFLWIVIICYYIQNDSNSFSNETQNSSSSSSWDDWKFEREADSISLMLELARRMHLKYGINLSPYDVVIIAYQTDVYNKLLIEQELAVKAKRLRNLPYSHQAATELSGWLNWQMVSKHRAIIHMMMIQPYPSTGCVYFERWSNEAYKTLYLESLDEEDDDDENLESN